MRRIGRRFEDIWSEIWHDILPIVEDAMQGRSTFHKDLPLTMNRKGYRGADLVHLLLFAGSQ